jgi:hypothetical protein
MNIPQLPRDQISILGEYWNVSYKGVQYNLGDTIALTMMEEKLQKKIIASLYGEGGDFTPYEEEDLDDYY